MLRRMGWLVLVLACMVSVAVGQDIRIAKPSGNGKSSIDLSGLRADSGPAAGLKAVLRDDLVRSGWFTVTDGGGGVAVRGRCSQGGQAQIEAEVINQAASTRYFSRSYEEPAATWRRAAHRLADDIIKAVKNKQGIASTRIAMVGSIGGRKNLYLCDWDGQGVMEITRDNVPCLTPSWAPNGRTLYYMSYLKGYADIYGIDLSTRQRTRLSSYPGINAGPAVSPDGGSLAVILSKDGNPDLYVMQLGSKQLQRITHTQQAAEASPTWSPDGSQLAYVSDSSGSPHVYVIARSGGRAKRVTLRGSENVSPDWGPDGRLAYSSRRGGAYQLCVLNPSTGEETQITGGSADYEEASWAPDARHLVSTKTQGYHSDLYVLDTLGDPEVRLTTLQGDWYSPAWSLR